MQQSQIRWDSEGFYTRKAIVELCGWCSKKYLATKIGLRIARTNWNDLTPAAKNVLIAHGVTQ